MEQKLNIKQFMDSSGKITQLQQKQKARDALLERLSEKFEMDHIYSEQQVNKICNQRHTLGDCFILWRELIDNGLLFRERDGFKYWHVAVIPTDKT